MKILPVLLLAIAFVVSVAAAPLTWGGAIVNFGKVAIGGNLTKNLTLSNPSSFPVMLEGMQVSGKEDSEVGAFHILSPQGQVKTTIAAGGSTTVTVSYRPTKAGASTVILSVSDKTGALFSCTLTGNSQ